MLKNNTTTIPKVGGRCRQPIDLHEYMVEQAYKGADVSRPVSTQQNLPAQVQQYYSQSPSISTPQQTPINAKITGFKDWDVYFDSYARDLTSDYSNGIIRWQVSNYNGGFELQNVVKIQLSPFFFVNKNNDTTRPDFFFYQRVFVQMRGIPVSQSVRSHGGTYFHFECAVENYNGQAVLLRPLHESFYFSQPLSVFSTFELQFLLPRDNASLNAIPLPSDTSTFVSVNPTTTPARFRLTGLDTTSILGPVGVPEAPGIAVFISNFITNNATIDNNMNDTRGIYITNIIDNTTFEIDSVNLTGIAATTGDIRVMKNRIAMAVRFTTKESTETNGIAVVHTD